VPGDGLVGVAELFFVETGDALGEREALRLVIGVLRLGLERFNQSLKPA